MQGKRRFYLYKVKRGVWKLHQLLQPLIRIYMKFIIVIINFIVFVYLALTVLSIIKEGISPTMDVENMASIAERGTIFSATLAVLTFTYASCFENFVKNHIIKIGEHFLTSTVLFLIGIIFLTGFGESFAKKSDLVSDSVFFYFIAIVLVLLTSVFFFVMGISGLLKQLFPKEYGIEELEERI